MVYSREGLGCSGFKTTLGNKSQNLSSTCLPNCTGQVSTVEVTPLHVFKQPLISMAFQSGQLLVHISQLNNLNGFTSLE